MDSVYGGRGGHENYYNEMKELSIQSVIGKNFCLDDQLFNTFNRWCICL